ncbi:MAG: hypothetical protein ACPG19_00170 [Saprospiraceae bacterium]
METNIKEVENFINNNPNKKHCDDCLSEILNIEPRQQINQICREKLGNNITRQRGVCSECKKSKLVNTSN